MKEGDLMKMDRIVLPFVFLLVAPAIQLFSTTSFFAAFDLSGYVLRMERVAGLGDAEGRVFPGAAPPPGF